MIPYLPETWPDSQRQVQVFTQFASRWPSFAGWCFTGHAHVQSFAELGPSKDALEKSIAAFTKEFGAPPGERKREWFDRYNRFIPDTYAAWDRAAREVNPAPPNTVSPGEHISSANGKYPPFIWERFPLQITHIQEEQWHERTVYPFMTDFVRRPGKPLISLNSMWNESESGQVVGREYFLALTRGVQGVGVAQVALQTSFCGVLPFHPFKSMHELLGEYGEFLSKLQPDHPIAILMPYEQPINPHSWSESVMRVFELYTAALYAHLPVSIIYEEDVAGLVDPQTAAVEPRIIIVTGLKNDLREHVLAGLKAFQAGGGVVFADAGTTAVIPGARRLDVDFGELYAMLSKTHAYWNSDSWNVRVDEVCIPKARKLRDAISPRHSLGWDIRIDDPHNIVGFHRYGETRYIVIANACVPPMKPEKMWRFTVQEANTLPAKPRVWLSGELAHGELYDLFARRKVDAERRGDTLEFTADLTRMPGRIYALLPAKIGALDIVAPRRVQLGQPVHVGLSATTPDGHPFPGLIPVSITVRDGDGVERACLNRAVPPEGLWCEIPTAATWQAAELRIEARELITGLGCRSTLNAEPVQIGEVMRVLPPVEVFDGGAIRSLLDGGKRFAILREEPHAALQPAVERITAILGGNGREIAVLDAKALLAAQQSFDCLIVPWTP
ncbi:MAG TPA: hypothetical protein VM223_03700, partial [Planctomycetota bacterium]|nr:hypothetical protein [Planctomycetota bacterium]